MEAAEPAPSKKPVNPDGVAGEVREDAKKEQLLSSQTNLNDGSPAQRKGEGFIASLEALDSTLNEVDSQVEKKKSEKFKRLFASVVSVTPDQSLEHLENVPSKVRKNLRNPEVDYSQVEQMCKPIRKGSPA